MKFAKLCLFAVMFLSTAVWANEEIEGEQLYKTYCDACHGMAGGMDMSKRIAPPMAAVRMHYIGTHTDKASFVAAISHWLEKPEESKTLMRGAIRRFKLMPAIVVSKADSEVIAGYIFDGSLAGPAGFQEHVNEMHGKGGMGKGMGKGKMMGKQ
ncbi:MAG: hypothetical protein KAR20_09715 [Candidatus Heimdallarchaeota archaeon]|nr:hypothetical protein [Candidatus Heimdallarchaeota archaeon]